MPGKNMACCLAGVSALALAFPATAAAQVQSPAASSAPDAEEAGREIVVTGTRLSRDPNATAPSPIVSVTANDLALSGETNVAETLREFPALISSTPASDSFGLASGLQTPGLATLDLRGLGENRTLVLVDGRRHVAGKAGSQAVDLASIPSMLIERVDILTGGASSVYGADAVTGVVNFILKRDHEGIDVRSQIGISERGDGRTFLVEGVWGTNFGDGRGNITLAGSYDDTQEILLGDRPFSANGATAFAVPNPALRFQRGDITADGTPNFARFFAPNRPRSFPYGNAIPTSAQTFINNYAAAFGAAPALTSAELAIISRAQAAPPLALVSGLAIAAQTELGVIGRADGRAFAADVDGNGTADCQQSYLGAATGFCYTVLPNGGIRPFQDGAIINEQLQVGGDGSGPEVDNRSLIPGIKRYSANLLGSFEFSDAAEVFGELKFVRSDTVAHDDLYADVGLLIRPDNPFIPLALRADAQAAGGLIISRQANTDLGSGLQTFRRDTYRGVAGLRGKVAPRVSYELAAVYGRTDMEQRQSVALRDRFFAAADVVVGPSGNPICRSDINPATPPGSPGFLTFKAGDGSCVPISLFNGTNSISPAAADWITETVVNQFTLDQFVVSAQVSGDSGGLFELPGGPIRFALGAEYREEKSDSNFDPLTSGTTRLFNNNNTLNLSGRYDVKEAFAEVELPLLRERPFFYDLRVGGAARHSNYSTIGNAFTWSVNGVYAPIRDVRFRGTYAKAIRAPNISELFSPEVGTLFSQLRDPCTQTQIDAFVRSGDPRAQNRVANCAAAGIPVGYVDPNLLATTGVRGGNRDLEEETAKTLTVGAVIQPSFVPGLVLSADYYDISIKNAIGAVGAQDVVNNCYDSPTLDNVYCTLLTRNQDPASPTFRDINFVRSVGVNFGRLETAGVDLSIGYRFALGEHRFALRANANWVDKLNRFFDPRNRDLVDLLLGEQGNPEWSGVGSITYSRGAASLTYRVQYIGEQVYLNQQIETADLLLGPGGGTADEKFVHDVAASIDVAKNFSFYGGVNNVTDTKPYITNSSYPVSGVGRFFFVGARAKF